VTPGKDGSERDIMTAARLSRVAVSESTDSRAPPSPWSSPGLGLPRLVLLMLLAVLACSSPPESRPTPPPTKAAVDYAAMESAIENKITLRIFEPVHHQRCPGQCRRRN
jgi:hypothetical protein